MQSTEHDRTNGKCSFRLVQLEVTVGRCPQNFSYPLRPNVGFQAERFKPLTTRSFPSKTASKKTLSLNHVLGTLLDVHMTNDWRAALLASIPPRNLKDRSREFIDKRKENNEFHRARFNALLALTSLEN
uniref:SAM-dependent MTase TRM10-type domain-containing protein n=1 Tax=Romanomermis culicivorax TaxID=13658 RepID=A0A915IZD5_ROMCU